jgi:hypothetical protein
MSSEATLWCAVIETAFNDATDKVIISRPLGKEGKWNPSQMRKKRALSFFNSLDGNFEWICKHLNLDAQSIREEVNARNSE